MSTRNKWLSLIGLIAAAILVDIIVGVSMANHERQHASVYRTALKTTDRDRFNYIVKSRQGRVISYTKLTGNEPARFNEMTIKRRFIAVKRTLEEYTMHTETTTDSKGNVTTRTYWSWDDAGTDENISKYLTIFGHKYSATKFNLDSFYRDINADKLVNHDADEYYYLNGSERYRYEVIPISVKGSFIADTSKGTLNPISGKYIKISKEHYKDYLNHNLNDGKKKVITAVVLLVLIEVIGIVYFCCEVETI
ncbi:hypothetical protein HUK49_03575 [Limosilactobacillus sp. c11Ua_112_M]|uniref:hypothetical protein n=1 Tax=Limosilactobacillus portuensis TaxID=2742601 RepID=UPI001781BB63|nr:hypothetical protein [Limosilactobacillus portuensis]MBD8087045.1 hypothetical protein [Limosilactobacillus portuensis]